MVGKAGSKLEEKFIEWMGLAGLTGYELQYLPRICGRKWRLDVAFPDIKVAAEIQGVNYTTGFGHQNPSQMKSDYEKFNALQADGWKVFLFLGRGDTAESHSYFKETVKRLRSSQLEGPSQI